MKPKSEEWWSLSEAIGYVSHALSDGNPLIRAAGGASPVGTLGILRALMSEGNITARRQGKNEIDLQLWKDAVIRGDGTAELRDSISPNSQPVHKRYAVEVLARDVLAFWPKTAARGRGRPSSWHLAKEEYRRRSAEGERHSNAEWGRILCGWLSSNHPGAAPLSPKTVENRINELEGD